MVNVQVSRFFRNAPARLTTSAISGNCGPALSFPVGRILALAAQPRTEGRVVCAGDMLRSALNRAVKMFVLLEVDWKHAQRPAAAGADHVNALVWSIFVGAIKTFQRAKDTFSLLPTLGHFELFATPGTSHEYGGLSLLGLPGALAVAVSNAKLLNPPTFDANCFVAKAAFSIHKLGYACMVLDKHDASSVTSRRQCSATPALALHRQIVHASSLP
jgi:hypothetical protein